jgi:hypothetical protein
MKRHAAGATNIAETPPVWTGNFGINAAEAKTFGESNALIVGSTPGEQ